MPDNLERYRVPLRPLPVPEPLPEGESPLLPTTEPMGGIVEPTEERKPGWQWVGSPARPEAQEHSDGISDLFDVDEEDVDAGEGLDDLVSVDIDKDIIDSNEDTGDLSDLTDVFEEDVMGMPETGQQPGRKFLRAKRRIARRNSRNGQPPPTSLGGMRG